MHKDMFVRNRSVSGSARVKAEIPLPQRPTDYKNPPLAYTSRCQEMLLRRNQHTIKTVASPPHNQDGKSLAHRPPRGPCTQDHEMEKKFTSSLLLLLRRLLALGIIITLALFGLLLLLLVLLLLLNKAGR